MPFTPSHAVVALPFLRTPLIPAAVAIGAMAPDLPLFVRGTPLSYEMTHTSFLVAGSLALALVALWYLLLRPAVREFSPDALARRLPQQWDATGAAVVRRVVPARLFARAALLVLSVFLGWLSHIVWDAFTHEGRWGLSLIPALAGQWGPLEGYKWLQHGSSLLGLVVIGVWALLWLRRREPAASLARVLPGWLRWFWWLSLPALLIGAVAIGFADHGPFTPEFTWQHLAYLALPPACAIWGALSILLCLIVLLRRRYAGTTQTQRGAP